MGATLLISELAARSGFSRSALRYYEQVGLLTVADRSAGGYRLYDEAAVTRLRFIERAKQLGLPLEEIRELVAVWDGGQCFTFTLHPAGDSVTWDVQAADDAAAVVVELFGTPK